MNFEGKTAFITGASRGIGAAVARMLHDRGANLALASRSGDDLGLERMTAMAVDVRDLDEMLDVNLKGTVYAIRAALPHMLGREGDLVTLASEAGRRGLPNEAVYCASKFGQVGLTRALDHELREHGIRCTNVCPGGVATDFALEEGRGRTEDVLPGMMTAEDVAEVVMFVLERPRHMRILETAFRPITEGSWG
jgi:3-oxoacyl-[acyl-carrier protein] reductase